MQSGNVVEIFVSCLFRHAKYDFLIVREFYPILLLQKMKAYICACNLSFDDCLHVT